MSDTAQRFAEIVGSDHLLTGDAIPEDYSHDEVLLAAAATARLPRETAHRRTSRRAAESRLGARGSGDGPRVRHRVVGCGPPGRRRAGDLVRADERGAGSRHHQPGRRRPAWGDADRTGPATADTGLRYMVYPGELSSSVGGNVGTNAGGMRAVKYGVARHNVLGLQAVLPTGEIIRTGGKIAKVSTGYDLTQLIVGSEGTLALVTEVIVKLHPQPDHSATVLAPFDDFDQVMTAVPEVLASGLAPYILEYIDNLTMAGLVHTQNLELGIPDQIRDSCQAYLVVALENRTAERLDEDVERAGELVVELGAMDAYVLEGSAARKLIEAREKAFWTAKAIGADDIIDTVVPRSAMPKFLATARGLATAAGGGAAGCGHAGDGNVHLAILLKDPDKRKQLMTDIFALAMELGGAISGEHGLGRAKTPYYLKLEDPAKVALMRRIKQSFDPAGILNPGVVFGAD